MPAALLANVVTDASEWLADFSSNWYFLAIIFSIALLDSVIPIVPGETMVIIGGVAAGRGDQWLLGVIAAGALGAFFGDNLAYFIGRRMSGTIERRAERIPKTRRRLDWATEQIHIRGGMLLITARFIPGGRTALTITSGVTNQPHRWFMWWVAIAAVIWATYAALIGYIGGQTFEEDRKSVV